MTKRKFVYNLRRASYEKEWGRSYEKPGPGAQFLAFLFRLVPKIGPFKVFSFKAPTPAAEKLYEASFNNTLTRYRQSLADLQAGHLTLPNENFDTGRPTHQGEYHMADQAYAKLLENLADKAPSPPEASGIPCVHRAARSGPRRQPTNSHARPRCSAPSLPSPSSRYSTLARSPTTSISLTTQTVDESRTRNCGAALRARSNHFAHRQIAADSAETVAAANRDTVTVPSFPYP